MSNLLIYALIGFLVGATIRLFLSDGRPIQILSTLLLGMAGAVIGALISWSFWPEVENQFQSGNLIVSMSGAFLLIVISTCVVSARRMIAERRSI